MNGRDDFRGRSAWSLLRRRDFFDLCAIADVFDTVGWSALTNRDMTLIKCDAPRQLYGDYLEWPEDKWGELVDGVAYIKEPPSPTWSHHDVVSELHRQVANAVADRPLIRACVAPFDVRLPKSTEADHLVDTVVQPDVFIVTEFHKLDRRGVRGAPAWVAEVLSPSTARHDRVVKVPAYERAGVREVWLIHPEELTLTVFRLDGSHYSPPITQPLRGQTQLSAVADVTVDWERVVARLWLMQGH